VAGPDTASRTTAVVESYDRKTEMICLVGDGITDQPGAKDGELCGVWRRSTSSTIPSKGDVFRFVPIVSKSGSNSATYIYGDVVDK
jgi:hypothetical protein